MEFQSQKDELNQQIMALKTKSEGAEVFIYLLEINQDHFFIGNVKSLDVVVN